VSPNSSAAPADGDTPQGHVPACSPTPRPVTSVHGFDRFFRAAMAQLRLNPTAASRTRLALPRIRHTAFDIQG